MTGTRTATKHPTQGTGNLAQHPTQGARNWDTRTSTQLSGSRGAGGQESVDAQLWGQELRPRTQPQDGHPSTLCRDPTAEPWLRGQNWDRSPSAWDGKALGHRCRIGTGRVPAAQAPALPRGTRRDRGDAGNEEQPSSPVCLALVHLCSTSCGDREPRHRHSLFFPTLLIKPTRNRSVCFHPQATASAQQSEDFFCIE